MRSGGSYFAERPLRLVEQNTVLRVSIFPFLGITIFLLYMVE